MLIFCHNVWERDFGIGHYCTVLTLAYHWQRGATDIKNQKSISAISLSFLQIFFFFSCNASGIGNSPKKNFRNLFLFTKLQHGERDMANPCYVVYTVISIVFIYVYISTLNSQWLIDYHIFCIQGSWTCFRVKKKNNLVYRGLLFLITLFLGEGFWNKKKKKKRNPRKKVSRIHDLYGWLIIVTSQKKKKKDNTLSSFMSCYCISRSRLKAWHKAPKT